MDMSAVTTLGKTEPDMSASMKLHEIHSRLFALEGILWEQRCEIPPVLPTGTREMIEIPTKNENQSKL